MAYGTQSDHEEQQFNTFRATNVMPRSETSSILPLFIWRLKRSVKETCATSSQQLKPNILGF
jgi:hypothetical protein